MVVKAREVESHRKEHDNEPPAAATATTTAASCSDDAPASAEEEVHGEMEAGTILHVEEGAVAGNILDLDGEREQQEQQLEEEQESKEEEGKGEELRSPSQEEVSKTFKEEITSVDDDNEEWADRVKGKKRDDVETAGMVGAFGSDSVPEAQPAALAA